MVRGNSRYYDENRKKNFNLGVGENSEYNSDAFEQFVYSSDVSLLIVLSLFSYKFPVLKLSWRELQNLYVAHRVKPQVKSRQTHAWLSSPAEPPLRPPSATTRTVERTRE